MTHYYLTTNYHLSTHYYPSTTHYYNITTTGGFSVLNLCLYKCGVYM